MSKAFHDVRNTKKMLAHGVQNDFGPFRKRPPKAKKAASEKAATWLTIK